VLILASAVGALLLLLLLHELGHFAVAVACKVHVATLSLGFGPRLASFERGGTRFVIRLCPVAAFVHYAAGSHREQDSYACAPPWKRALVDLGGPLASYGTSALIVFVLALTGWLTPVPCVAVASVEPHSRAALAGVRLGQAFEALPAAVVDSADASITFEQRPCPQGLAVATQLAFLVPLELGREQLAALEGLLGRGETERLQGPVAASRDLAVEARRGFFSLASAVALLSMAIACFNLLPIPGLDGGKLAFNVVEALSGRRLSSGAASRLQAVCLCLLLVVIAVLSAIELASEVGSSLLLLLALLLLGSAVGVLRPRSGSKPFQVVLALSTAAWLLATLGFVASTGLASGILLGAITALLVAVVGAVGLTGYYLAAKSMLRSTQ
jgi:regulator of sigma E protease